MNSDEFGQWLEGATPALDAWGCHVVSTICERVQREVGEKRYAPFFKVPPAHRVKLVGSAKKKLEKKKYKDPVQEMTDLVGARFIVLVRTDLTIVENVINSCNDWVARRDRDFEAEVAQEPAIFDYQSIHYLLRSREEAKYNDVVVPEGTSCEVQVRTLLQHAYAELVHDNVYKPEGTVPASTKRLVAKCMALMETTDDMFCQALKDLSQVNTDREMWLTFLPDVYGKATGKHDIDCSDADTLLVLDTYRDVLQLANRDAIAKLFLEPILAKHVRTRIGDRNLFARPVCAAVYWLAENYDRELLERWPLGSLEQDLHTVLADVGKSAL